VSGNVCSTTPQGATSLLSVAIPVSGPQATNVTMKTNSAINILNVLVNCLCKFIFRPVNANVLELCFGRFETVVFRNVLTKLNVYWTFAKRKLTNCLPRLQKPKPNAQMGFRLVYHDVHFYIISVTDGM
jgi:hypothetical protein